MNPQLHSIAIRASQDLVNLVCDGEQDILAAIHKVVKEAQLQEAKPKFVLNFKVAVDYDKSTFDCDLSLTLKQSLSASHTIDDPDQSKFELDPKNRELAENVDVHLAESIRRFAKTIKDAGATCEVKIDGQSATG